MPFMQPRDPSAVSEWPQYIHALAAGIAPHFTRREAWLRGVSVIRGLLSSVERKNSWQLAEAQGESSPYCLQHFMGKADWDEAAVLSEVRKWYVSTLRERERILVFDETGFLKKGKQSAGVARQYSGTAGRTENCQIGVFAALVSGSSHSLVDCELYLPLDWTQDEDRCAAAGIPAEREFLTKPQLAVLMSERMLDEGLRPDWVTADSVYGDNPDMVSHLVENGIEHVLCVSKATRFESGKTRSSVERIFADLPESDWKRLSAADGSKGPRTHDWSRIHLNDDGGFEHCLLARRSVSKPEEIRFYRVFAQQGTSLQTLVHVAACRWRIEECFQTAKGETGLDEYEVRKYRAWYRHMTLSMAALGLLTVLADEHREPSKKGAPPKGSMQTFRRKRGLS